jgi:hypothetical protein
MKHNKTQFIADVYFGFVANSRHVSGGANQLRLGRINQTWRGRIISFQSESSHSRANQPRMNVPWGESTGYLSLYTTDCPIKSTYFNIICSVPKGSMLGTLLFTTYSNYLSDYNNRAITKLFNIYI